MPKMEFKKQETLSRREAAARMMEVAQALGNSDEFELERGGEKLQLDVPAEVTLKLEVEIEDGETELEVEIKGPRRRQLPHLLRRAIRDCQAAGAGSPLHFPRRAPGSGSGAAASRPAGLG